jgi:hypothetical protein
MSVTPEPLQEELSFFAANQDEWRKIYLGKFILVKGHDLVGVFDKPDDALVEGAMKFGPEPFLVRPVLATKDQENLFIPVLALGLLNMHAA